jgi:hypothetical protein
VVVSFCEDLGKDFEKCDLRSQVKHYDPKRSSCATYSLNRMVRQRLGLGLDIEPARLGSARLGMARYINELARLGLLSLTSSKISSTQLGKKL